MIKVNSKPFVSFWIILTCLPISGLAQEKSFYGKIDPKIRLQILANARTMKTFDPAAEIKKEDDKNNLTHKIDVVKYLTEKCDFPYTRDVNGLPVRPQVNCVYKPKEKTEEFSGMTAKFDCLFTSINKDGQTKEKILKVKYEPKKYAGGGHKEIPQAVMGTTLARLMNFNTSAYCPVDLTCKDCPSDNPWAQEKSSAPAMAGNIVEFKNVVVESKMKGYKVEDSKNQSIKDPQGFTYRDLNRYFPKTQDSSLLATMRAEREALTIWINFVVSGDADHHNNKLFCTNSTKPTTPEEIPKCLESAAVINDYGNSLGYTNADTRLQLSKFSRNVLRSDEDAYSAYGASGNAGASYHPISDAGRLLFIQQADAITEAQLLDVFNLAQVEKVSDGNALAWLKAFRQKVQKMK
jgi:hypothetical protein